MNSSAGHTCKQATKPLHRVTTPDEVLRYQRAFKGQCLRVEPILLGFFFHLGIQLFKWGAVALA